MKSTLFINNYYLYNLFLFDIIIFFKYKLVFIQKILPKKAVNRCIAYRACVVIFVRANGFTNAFEYFRKERKYATERPDHCDSCFFAWVYVLEACLAWVFRLSIALLVFGCSFNRVHGRQIHTAV